MRFKRYIVLTGLLIANVPLVSFAQEIKTSSDEIVAHVGEESIKNKDLQSILVRYRAHGDTLTALETLTPKGKEKILNEIIDQRLLSLQAITNGMDRRPEVMFAVRIATEKVLAERLMEAEIDKLDLSDSALKTFYEKNTALFTREDQIKARHVITSTRKSAEEALLQINAGRPFDIVAGEYNIDKSKLNGGDLGWVAKGRMVKSFEDTLFALEEGDVSDIIKTSFGYHIVKAEAIKKGKLKPFESIKADIRQKIIHQHISALKEKLREIYPVTINRKLLE